MATSSSRFLSCPLCASQQSIQLVTFYGFLFIACHGCCVNVTFFVAVKLILNDHLTVRSDELVAAEQQVQEWVQGSAIKNPPVKQVSQAVETLLVPKSIVLYMIGTKPEHYIDLLDSLNSLHRYYLSRWGYEVLIMHEGLTSTQMQRLSDIYPRTSFYLLNLTFPLHINASSVSYQVAGHASIGYRHMCRFYSGGIFSADVMAQYDWYLMRSYIAATRCPDVRPLGTGASTATAFCWDLCSMTLSASYRTPAAFTVIWHLVEKMNTSQLVFGQPR